MAKDDPRVVALKELRKTINGQLLDSGLRHALYKGRLGRKHARELALFLEKQVLPDLIRKAEHYIRRAAKGESFGLWSADRVAQQMRAYYQAMRQSMQEAGEGFARQLDRMAMNEAHWQAWSLRGTLPQPIPFDVHIPTLERMSKIVRSSPFQGRVLKKHFSRFAAMTRKELDAAIKVGILEGETTWATARKLRHIYGKIDVAAKVIKQRVESLVLTATSHVQNRAAIELFRQNRDILAGWLFVATLDAGTTDICMSLDGRFYKIGEGAADYPPLHFRCRSFASPQVKSWREMGYDYKDLSIGERAALGGPVPVKVKYSDWIVGQPFKVQADALGVRYATLFRDGKMSFREIMKAKGVKKSALDNL